MTGAQAAVVRGDDLAAWALWMRAIGRSDRTVITRTGQVRRMCRVAGLDDPAAVATSDVVAWLATCSNAWTRYTYSSSVRAWCAWLVDAGIRDDDPTARLPKPRSPRGVPRPVPWSVIDTLMADPPSVRCYAYVALAAYAGLRVHEIAKVRGEDVDTEAGWLYVDGKGGVHAAVPLHPVLGILAQGMPPAGWWFPGVDAGHVRAHNVSLTVSKALHRHSGDGTAHRLRHSFGTEVLRSSRDLRVTQELLRHQSPATTAVYTQVSDMDKVAAVNRLGRGNVFHTAASRAR